MPTVNLQVGAGNQDAQEQQNDSNFTSTGGTLALASNTTESNRIDGGFHFSSVSIPFGAKVSAADFQPYMFNVALDDPNCDIYCEDADDAADFTADADLVNRTRTTASVEWVETGVGTGFVSAPDISAPVQEVLDRSGWASGNDMLVYLRAKSDTTSNYYVTTYDGLR